MYRAARAFAPRSLSILTLLAATVLTLGGCGSPPSAPPAPAVSTGTTSVAETRPATPSEFTVASAHAKPYNGQLAIVLEFSQPLAGALAFDQLISVKDAKGGVVSGAWSLDEDGTTLRFPYVKANETYSVTFTGEIAAAGGSTLPANFRRDIFTGPLEPAVAFASQGHVLPARDTRGLPLVSVNVREVDVEFFRVREKELSQFFASFQGNGRRYDYQLDSDYHYSGRTPLTAIADSVYANRFTVSGKENERAVTYLPIQDLPELSVPGVYFAVLKRAGRFKDAWETCYFFVSDIGLHTRVYKEQLFVHTASLKSGVATSGVDIDILDKKGETIVSARTDDDGNALIPYKLDASHVVVARHGRDISLLPMNQPALDLSDFVVAGRKQTWFDVFAWSGRDLYRPGETLRLSALLRDFDGKPIDPQPLFLTLKQPDGKTWAQARLEPRDLGLVEWSYELPADVPTGRWQVEFRVDPAAKEASQAITFRVEEFLPERLKLALDSTAARLRPGEALPLSVEGDYLYGAPASGNRFTARLTLANETHPVEKLKDYHFGDPTLELPKGAKDVIDQALDNDGKLTASVPLAAAALPAAPISAIISGSVYESGGRTVTRTLKRTQWPADTLVGVHPLFDLKDGAPANGSAGFQIVRSDAEGQLAAGTVKVTLVREERDYHWNYDRDSGWRFDFTRHYMAGDTREVTLDAGQAGKIEFPVTWGNYRLEVLDPATGLTMRFPFVAGWSYDNDNAGKEARPDKVKLALDKSQYRAGDTLKVTVTPPQGATGILLVESDRLLLARTIQVKDRAEFELPVTADWERHDVYISTILLRGGSASSKVTPARAVGVVHVPMDRGDRKVAVTVTAPESMKPETDMAVTVKAPALAGQKAYVTVSAVDVGILNITQFPLPDATAWFFGQRRLGVDAYDLYGRVIESFEGSTARLRYGGDLLLSALPQARRPTAKVKTVDLYSGPVQLDAQGTAEVTLAVPDFNGTLRVATLVFGADRYGNAQAETIVRAPLVAEVSSPRALAPGDKAVLTLDVTNFSGIAQDVDLRVEATAPLRVDNGRRAIRLDDGAKSTAQFPLSAGEGNGIGHFRLVAKAGDIRIERDYEIAIRPAWPSVVLSTPRALETATPISLGEGSYAGLMPSTVAASISVSRLPPLPFASAMRHLLDYAYGCIEQTTSKAYGLLALDEAHAKILGLAPVPEAARRDRIARAISRISSMQIPSGHFSMWGGDSHVNEMLTPYVTEFLLDARDSGFAVPEEMLQRSLKRLNDDLLSGGHPYYSYDHPDHLRFADQAWSAYVLARVQRAPLGTLRTLFDNERQKSITALPLVHLGIALTLQGDKVRGEKAIAEAFAKKVERPAWLGDYGSDLRDTALMVALLHQFDLATPEHAARVVQLGRELVARRQEKTDKHAARIWLSTQDQVAIARLGKQLVAGNTAAIEGKLVIGGTTTPLVSPALWTRTFTPAEIASGVRIEPAGEGPFYVSEDVAGIPNQAPPPDENAVFIRRRWYTLDGAEWKGTSLKEGEGLIVGIQLEARQAMKDALLVDLLPAGLELENFNLTDSRQWADVVVNGVQVAERAYAADVTHEEFRDDRYVAALSLQKGQKANVFYLVRAVSPGTFVVPPTSVEDMYRPQLRAIGESVPATIEVREP
ncbi:alpha-2-macroglobulin family protein [Tahibacter amnicola]|uniref:Alpha-2-macroglobulin n=1 Tax=Tahibacter amnicola TaxID=2976241 RepID=A0ABY6BD97_9GAMM|nr:alpha-2-macroglobulin [Tahibacter amnicola]UXI67085.1 alpha-2-macroglobulin family protein [Tahibacter amnicola]